MNIKSLFNVYVTLFLLGTLYVYCATFGYGNDCDTYLMLRVWKLLVNDNAYIYSRWPGYPIPEILIGLTANIGGFYFSNFVSVILSLGCLLIFYNLLIKVTSAHMANLSLFFIGLNPYYIISSSSSMDYIYGAFFFLSGSYLLLQRRSLIAGLMFGFAVGSRCSYALLIALTYSGYFLYSLRQKNLLPLVTQIKSIFLFLITGLCLYIPAFFAANKTLVFLNVQSPDFNLFQYLSRYLYKNIYLWGLPTFLVLIFIIFKEVVIFIKERSNTANIFVTLIMFAAILITEILFFRFPWEASYLIPLLFLFTFLLILWEYSARWFYLLIVLNIIYIFVNFDILDISRDPTTNQPVAARPGFYIRPGPLVHDLRERAQSQKTWWGLVEMDLEEIKRRRSSMSSDY